MSEPSQALPWWQTIPPNFHNGSNSTEINQRFPWLVGSSAAFDHGLSTWLASVISTALAPRMLSRKKFEHDLSHLQFYKALSNRQDADAVFPPPPDLVPIRVQEKRASTLFASGIHCRHLSFGSPFQTLNPAMSKTYLENRRNQQAHAEYWYSPKGPRPTLIVTHGFIADPYYFNAMMFSLKWFYERGYDILLYTLPFHGPRKERHDLHSGFGYFSHGLASTNEAMAQALHDLRVFINYLEKQGTPSIGATGISLGGYITSLLASAEPRLNFAIPNSPVVSPVDLFMEWRPVRWLTEYVLANYDLKVADLRHMTAFHSALNYTPKVDPKRLLIIAGAGDRVTPPKYVNLLHEHWDGSRLHWFPGNHILHFHQRRYLKFMKVFMDHYSQVD